MAADRTPAELVVSAWREAAADAATLPMPDVRPIAIGWATVEMDRAVGELTVALGLGVDQPFRPAPRSDALGTSCRVAAAVLPHGGSLVVLEPDTEGRLAGSLARFGEGLVAAWLSVPTLEAGLAAMGRANFTVSPERDGPFGGERLITGRLDTLPGRHLLLVPRATGTIHP